MDALRSWMPVLLAMAALSQLIEVFAGDDSAGSGPGMICSLCAAACMLRLCRALLDSF